jgi:diguanylate cyclase (GGDEF)-like protein
MTNLIDTVAELTHLRDRDALELTFGNAIFELASAASLSVWRTIQDGPAVRLRRRLSLPGAPAADQPPADMSLGDAPAAWRECYARRCLVKTASEGDGLTRQVFPLCDDRRVTGLLEIRAPSGLEAPQAHLVEGLVRVYRNHMSLLDYGARDELTGMLNRRMFNGFFNQVNTDCQLHAAIAVVDIDFFKRINDQFGHPYGDEVLVLMARLIEQSFPGWEGLFRFGGEEFVLIMTETALDEAWVALECFRSTVSTATFPQIGQVTVSIGFSMIRPGDTGADAFGRADQALYVAKHSGRDQVQNFEALIETGTITEAKLQGGAFELF